MYQSNQYHPQPNQHQQYPNQYQQPPPNHYQPVPSPNQYGQHPPPQGNPLPGCQYTLRLPWGCSESCKYYCEGYCEYEFAESDPKFSSSRQVGIISQRHFISYSSRDPFQAHLEVGGQELAMSKRHYKCCAPLCNEDEAYVTRVGNTPLGCLKAKGCACFNVSVFAPNEQLLFLIKREICDCSIHINHSILDPMNNKVGLIRLLGCKCCEYKLEIELPQQAHQDQKILLIFAAHFLENIYRETQQNQDRNTL